jgi:hypothetical protein
VRINVGAALADWTIEHRLDLRRDQTGTSWRLDSNLASCSSRDEAEGCVEKKFDAFTQ